MGKTRILVTGGLGFIGSHTVVELQRSGFDVIVIDDLSNSREFVRERIEQITGQPLRFYRLNLLDSEGLKTIFEQKTGIAAVIHFAAFKAVGESVAEPLKYFHNNLLSLLHLLERMEEFRVRNLVFSSSATVYGDPLELPVRETTPFNGALSPYGSTKQMGEEILEKTTAAKNIRAISLRYFNPVGAHESALIGELPLGVPNNLMPYITQTAAGIREKLTLFGDDYETPDGTCLRDYVHVVDLAKAHVKSCERLLQDRVSRHHEVFNIGTGEAISVMEMILAFEKYNKLQLNYTIGPRRPGDVAAVYADVTRANRDLPWKAERGLEEMVTSAWKWQQQLNP